MVWRGLATSLALSLVTGCQSGRLGDPADAAPDGAAALDGDADSGCAEPPCAVDPCDTLTCPVGQECVEGRCRAIDNCQGIVCENPGEVCDPRDGACHHGAADDDGDGFRIVDGDCDDGDPWVYPNAPERCDGVDQDCDLEVDEGFADGDGDGFDTCGFGDPSQADCDDGEPRRHPGLGEICDGLDNDCDAEVDDGLVPHECSTRCGVGEARCEGGRWVCSAPEVCECAPAGGVEEEACGNCGVHSRTCDSELRWGSWSGCEGEGVCAEGAVEARPCGSCGEERRTCTDACAWGPWGACLGEGVCSPASVEPCPTECGSVGERACGPTCEWGACAAPPEACNRGDDDCDGLVDEGFRAEVVRTTFTTLATHHSVCSDSSQASTVGCQTAIHRFCSEHGCSVSGFGPVEYSGDDVWVVCVAGASVQATTYAALAAAHPWCNGDVDRRVGPGCNAAVKRHCIDLGFTSGFGPFETSGDVAHVTCLDSGSILLTSFSTLATHHEVCDGVTSRWGGGCNAAIHRFCRASGHTSGFGPVESDITDGRAWVTCVEP